MTQFTVSAYTSKIIYLTIFYLIFSPFFHTFCLLLFAFLIPCISYFFQFSVSFCLSLSMSFLSTGCKALATIYVFWVVTDHKIIPDTGIYKRFESLLIIRLDPVLVFINVFWVVADYKIRPSTGIYKRFESLLIMRLDLVLVFINILSCCW